MGCDEIRIQLATYRELPPREREAVDRHLGGCPLCMAAFEQYQAQDRALAALKAIETRPAWSSQVRERTVRRAPAPPPRLRPLRAMAMAIVALVVIGAGTLGASAQALPGGGLYPVKRAVEQVRLGLTTDGTKRTEYLQALAEVRRAEIRQVAEQGKTAEVAFEGHLQEVGDSTWVVDGITIEVDPVTAQVGRSLVGSRVSIQASVDGGQVAVSDVKIDVASLPRPTAIPTQTPKPTAAPPTRVVVSAPPAVESAPGAKASIEENVSGTRLAEVKQTAESALGTAVARVTERASAPSKTATPTPAQVHATPTRDLRTIRRLETRLAARALTITAMPTIRVGTRVPDGLPTVDATLLATYWPTGFPQITGTLPAEWQTVLAWPTGHPGDIPIPQWPPFGKGDGKGPDKWPAVPPVFKPGEIKLPDLPDNLPSLPKFPPGLRDDEGDDAADDESEADRSDDQGEDGQGQDQDDQGQDDDDRDPDDDDRDPDDDDQDRDDDQGEESGSSQSWPWSFSLP